MRASSPACRSNMSGSRRNVAFVSFSRITRQTSPPSAHWKHGNGRRWKWGWENRSGVSNSNSWHGDDGCTQMDGGIGRSLGDKEFCETVMSFVTSVSWLLCVRTQQTLILEVTYTANKMNWIKTNKRCGSIVSVHFISTLCVLTRKKHATGNAESLKPQNFVSFLREKAATAFRAS